MDYKHAAQQVLDCIEMCIRDRLYSKQSDYQRIDIFETPEFGRVLTLDGNVMPVSYTHL